MVHAPEVERLRGSDLGADLDGIHALFQTSTLDAMLDGRYDGDVTFAQLRERGDLGLGTLDALDGEMIGVDAEIELDHTSHLHLELPEGVERVQHHTSAADRGEIKRMEG